MEKFMLRAIALAEKGRGFVSPNPLVGAVLVKGGKIISQGWHEEYGGKHAEANAIESAGKNAKGSELYVTLEPCNHFGKQPPCTRTIISAGILKVYAAIKDPNKMSGSGHEELAKNNIPVEFGLCAKIAEKQNEIFIKNAAEKKPFVALHMALTLDGFIAWGNRKKKQVSGREAKEFVQELRRKYDAILVGVKTIVNDNPRLTYRKNQHLNPVRIVLDPMARTPLKSAILKQHGETIIVCTKKAKSQKIWELMIAGAQIIVAKEKNGKINLAWLLKKLYGIGICSVFVEGGAKTNSEFVKSGLYDKVYMLIAPKKVRKGLPALENGIKIPGKLSEIQKLGKDILAVIGR